MFRPGKTWGDPVFLSSGNLYDVGRFVFVK
jgi:hypothetical protein